jgi:hypothetical protein
MSRFAVRMFLSICVTRLWAQQGPSDVHQQTTPPTERVTRSCNLSWRKVDLPAG